MVSEAIESTEDLKPFSGERFCNFYGTWCFGQRYSANTKRRWRKRVSSVDQFSPAESEFLRHAWIASEYLRAEELRCFETNAHFAVGTLLMSRLELLIQMHLIFWSDEVRKLSYYRARSKRRGCVKVIASLRLNELFALAQAIKLFSEVKLIHSSLDVIASFGYPKDTNGALKYLRDRRNQLHPATLAKNIPTILRELPVDPEHAFNTFYFDYAAVALQVLGGVNASAQFQEQKLLHHL